MEERGRSHDKSGEEKEEERRKGIVEEGKEEGMKGWRREGRMPEERRGNEGRRRDGGEKRERDRKRKKDGVKEKRMDGETGRYIHPSCFSFCHSVMLIICPVSNTSIMFLVMCSSIRSFVQQDGSLLRSPSSTKITHWLVQVFIACSAPLHSFGFFTFIPSSVHSSIHTLTRSHDEERRSRAEFAVY